MIEITKHNSKKRPTRLGLKCILKLASIEVSGLVVPATHLGLGVNNNIIAVFGNTAKKDTIEVSEHNRRKWHCLKVLATEMKEKEGRQLEDSTHVGWQAVQYVTATKA
jgi:hypothetical protein